MTGEGDAHDDWSVGGGGGPSVVFDIPPLIPFPISNATICWINDPLSWTFFAQACWDLAKSARNQIGAESQSNYEID